MAICHLLGQRCLLHQLTVSLHEGSPLVRDVRTLPVIEGLPLWQGTCREQPMRGQWCCRIRSCLFFVIVRPSHSAVRGRPVGAKFDSILFQTFLDDEGKELICTIYLNSLNKKYIPQGHDQGTPTYCSQPTGYIFVKPDNRYSRQQRCIDICRCDFADIHLYPFTENRALTTMKSILRRYVIKDFA